MVSVPHSASIHQLVWELRTMICARVITQYQNISVSGVKCSKQITLLRGEVLMKCKLCLWQLPNCSLEDKNHNAGTNF